MKLLKSIVLLIALLNLTAFCEPAKPEDVPPITKIAKSNDWYLQQIDLWKKVVEQNPTDEKAWRNYYLASRYANFPNEGPLGFDQKKKNRLDDLVNNMASALPNSCNTHYVQLLNTPLEQQSLEPVRKAYNTCPDNYEILQSCVFFFEMNGHADELKSVCRKIHQKNKIDESLLDYNYNLLNSVDKNAILFSNGDNDSYPGWILQRAHGIREDVTVLNRYMVFKNKTYLARKLKEKGMTIDIAALPFDGNPTDLLCSLSKAIKLRYPATPIYFASTIIGLEKAGLSLYNIGVVYLYSEKPVDNIAYLIRNFETKYRLDYLMHDWYAQSGPETSHPMDAVYIYPLLTLMQHHKITGEREKMGRWRTLAAEIMERTNNKQAIALLKDYE